MRISQLSDRWIRAGWAVMDGVIWFFAVLFGTWLRYQYSLAEAYSETVQLNTLLFAADSAALHVLIGVMVGPYRSRRVRGSYEEVVELTTTTAMAAAIMLAVLLTAGSADLVPRTVPIIGAFVALTLMMSTRFVVRWFRQQRTVRSGSGEPIIVFGAGVGGRLLVRNLINDPQSPYRPVALLDDDPYTKRLMFAGVRVLGNRNDIQRVAKAVRAKMLVIAIPSAESPTLREISDLATEAGLRTLVVPPLHTLVGHEPSARDLRDINVEDLLGRRPITLDERAIAQQLTGRRVLVTGAGGSIGSELARQISHFGPDRLILLDRDESALHGVQLDLSGHGLLDNDQMVLADIRDPEALRRVFEHYRPEIVFHAAALKHLPLLQRFPLEAWQTNVLGTLNVLRAAQAVGVETFVNISTDKAADPTCVLGYSKRIAERLTAGIAAVGGHRYMSVRFGNVLGSRGSVIPAFTEQIRRGGPVTVTHPEVERYFMLIPEACQLVMQAAAIGKKGEVMVLDMGRPVKILDVAKTLIQLSGREDIDITFTGLRPGEKMSEDLFNATDASRTTEHPLVSSVDVPTLGGEKVDTLRLAPDRATDWMRDCARATTPDASLRLLPASMNGRGIDTTVEGSPAKQAGNA